MRTIEQMILDTASVVHRFVVAWLLPLLVMGLGLWVITASHNHVASELSSLLQIVPVGWFGLLCGAILLTNGALMWRAQRRHTLTPAPFSRWWVLGGIVAVIAATWSSTTWMLSVAQPEQQLSAIQSGLTVAAGTGGALGLALIARKQWHQENVHLHERRAATQQQRDADERRFLESFNTALQLLESEISQTRQGGLALLESIGEKYPDWQSTVVRTLCSFLQRPLPSGIKIPDPSETPSPNWLEAYQERLQAINILVRHLPSNTETEWRGGMEFSNGEWGHHPWELAGAVIPNLELRGKELRDADFSGSVIVNPITINNSTLLGTKFTDAIISEGVRAVNATILDTDFERTSIGYLTIAQSHLSHVTFRDSSFLGPVIVGTETRLKMGVNFTGAQYKRAPEFRGAL
ncbi:pentapeptide repeat-containing protein, partial [Bacillus mobilis]